MPLTVLSPSWPAQAWLALGLRGRLVAGYTALFAVLLICIAIGETTVVRQVLIDDRRAALPGASNDVATAVTESAGGIGTGLVGPLPIVSGNADMILALLSPTGSVLYRQAGSDVNTVDPTLLLDTTPSGPTDSPATYQRSIGTTSFVVRLRSMPATVIQTLRAPDPGGLATAGRILSAGPVAPGAGLTLLVAESLKPVDATINTMLLITLAASAAGLAIAAAIGLAVARRALNPLERMTATAQAIATGGDGALDRRLGLPGSGDEVGRLATTFDRMLDRIQATIAERARSEASLRRFAADASHELRTPLAAVSGYAEVLLMGGKDDPKTTERALRDMNHELGRMKRLVTDLLTLARLDAGLPVRTRLVEIVPFLDGLAEQTRGLAAHAGRELDVAVEYIPQEDDRLAVLADPDRLHQILLNLLHNALKFTPDGGRITLKAQRCGDTVILCVSDTGVGIDADRLPLLFERFYRGDTTRSRPDCADDGGAGLGLAIAQGLARSLGGRIDVTSGAGQGSTFGVTLPAAATCSVETA